MVASRYSLLRLGQRRTSLRNPLTVQSQEDRAMAHPSPEQELEQRNRLPTLMEVLGRRTLAPVDLFSFYIYMRDQQRSVDYLDFWSVWSRPPDVCC